MGNYVSSFFDEDNDEVNPQEQIQPPLLHQIVSNKKKNRKNKTARKRKVSEKQTMNNYSSYNE